MAIKSIKGRGAPLIARIRKGAPKPEGNRPGADLDYFRVEFEDSPLFDKAEALAIWQELYGDKPQVLDNVQFTVDGIDNTFDSWMETWGRSQNGTPLLNIRCDSETICAGSKFPVGTPCKSGACDCKPTGRLLFMLPEFSKRLGVIGHFMLLTTSVSDIANIKGTLETVEDNIARLRGLAFTLYRKEHLLKTPDGKPVKKWLVHLDIMNAGAQRIALAAMEQAQQLAPGEATAPALPAPATSWASLDAIKGVMVQLNQTLGTELDASDICDFAGIDFEQRHNMDLWNAKYPSAGSMYQQVKQQIEELTVE